MMRFFSLVLAMLSATIIYADIPAGYYDKAVGLKDAQLKTVMHDIIASHTRIEYGADGTWMVFRTSDVRYVLQRGALLSGVRVASRYAYRALCSQELVGRRELLCV